MNEQEVNLTPGEVKELLEQKPQLVRNLGYAAYNTGLFRPFQQLLDNNHDFKQMRGSMVQEFRESGIDDVDDFLTLYGIRPEYDEYFDDNKQKW